MAAFDGRTSNADRSAVPRASIPACGGIRRERNRYQDAVDPLTVHVDDLELDAIERRPRADLGDPPQLP